MKKITFVLFAIGIVFLSCEKKSIKRPTVVNSNETTSTHDSPFAAKQKADAVKEFFQSGTYKRIKEQLKDYGTIDKDDYFTLNYENDPLKPLFSFKIVKNGEQVARLNVIPLPEGLGYNVPNPQNKTVLPFNDRYLVLLMDFTNVTGENGEIRFYDINYGYLAGIKRFQNGIETFSQAFETPPAIVDQYRDLLFTLGEVNPNVGNNPQSYLICDENHDGNIGFGECWRCFTNACAGDPTCSQQCYIIGYLTPYNCGVSIGLACAYISIVY